MAVKMILLELYQNKVVFIVAIKTEANIAISSGFCRWITLMLCTSLYVTSPTISESALSLQIVARAMWAEKSLYSTTVASLRIVEVLPECNACFSKGTILHSI